MDRYVFQKAMNEDIDEILKIIKKRIKWMDENNISQWNKTNYLKYCPKNYYEELVLKGQLYVAKYGELNSVIGIRTYRLSSILYLIAALLVSIPLAIVLITGLIINSVFSKIILFSALAFIIVGKILTTIKKNEKEKNNPKDIGIIIGFLILLISRALK